jgi:hypothetical protein
MYSSAPAHIAQIHQRGRSSALADSAVRAEGANALSVAVECKEEPGATQLSSDGSPGTQNGARNDDQELQPNSLDYNDVNFWKPSMYWFHRKEEPGATQVSSVPEPQTPNCEP